MSISRTVTEQDITKIVEKVSKADRKNFTHFKRAKLITNMGYIGFCLGQFLAGIYDLYATLMDQAAEGVDLLPGWYASIGQTITEFVPVFPSGDIRAWLLMAVMALVCGFAGAFLGKLISVFVSTRNRYVIPEGTSPQQRAEMLQRYINGYRSIHVGRFGFDDFYPKARNIMFILYSIFPCLCLIAGEAIGGISLLSKDFYAGVDGIVGTVIITALPVVLLRGLSAIINSIFYIRFSKCDFSHEESQLQDYIAQCEREEQEEKEKIAKKKREEQLKQAEIIYQQAIADDPMNEAELKKAADMGHPEACLRYGLVLLSNLDTSAQTNSEIRKINETAAKYFETPAKQGNKEAEFYWLISRCQYESGDEDHWEEILYGLRLLKQNGHVPSHMQGVCDMAIENAVECINDLESRTYSSYSTSSYTPSHSSYSHDKGLNTYMTDIRNGQTIYYQNGKYVNESGQQVPTQYIDD